MRVCHLLLRSLNLDFRVFLVTRLAGLLAVLLVSLLWLVACDKLLDCFADHVINRPVFHAGDILQFAQHHFVNGDAETNRELLCRLKLLSSFHGVRIL